jgi:DNA-binding LacI/PurR family transcriptional regulator
VKYSPNQQIKRQLLRHILDGQFEPNQTLPTIEALARTFKVSTKTVQKAIHALSAEGVIEAKRGTGLFVKPIDSKGGGGKRIGFVHPNSPTYLTGERYPKPIVDAFERVMKEAGFTVIACGLARMDRLVLEESLLKLRLNGLLLFELDSDILLSEFRDMRLPMVSVDYDSYRHGISSIFIDNVWGCFEATKHLIDLGHKSIAFMRPLMRNAINNGSLDSVEEERMKGYRVAMQQAGLPILIEEFTKGAEGAGEAVRRLVQGKSPPTAFVTSSDGYAVMIAHEAQKQGLTIPGDVSVVGFGNDHLEYEPGKKITSVAVPWKEMGETAAEVLLETLKGGARPQRRTMPVKLAPHESSGPRKK